MSDRTASRVTLNGRNWSQGTRPQQTDADRLRINGKLQSANDDTPGPLRMLATAVLCAVGFYVVALLIWAVS